MVQTRWHDECDIARFSAAERRDDIVPYWQLLQIKPCDTIEVWLSGQLAMTGTIIERQVAYDADNHGVQFTAKGKSRWAYKSSVNSQTGSFDQMSFEEIYKKVLSPYGTPLVVGVLNPLKFQKVQNQPGESNWDFLERLARVRGIILASDYTGPPVAVGIYNTQPRAALIEGVNIQAMNAVINVDETFVNYKAIGQMAASNETSGTAASEQESPPVGGTGCNESILITPSEQPVTLPELLDRARNEAKWHEAAKLTCTIVVQGWTYDGVNLWRVGTSVWVKSKMAMLDNKLSIRRATYTQDRNQGSLTTLECVWPWMLNDSPEVEGLNPTPPDQPPGAPPTAEQIKDTLPFP